MTVFESFIDELNKLAEEEGKDTMTKIVHHPLFQAAGYGALAGEGIHELAHRAPSWLGGKAGKKLHSMATSKWGGRAGTAAIGGSAAFLGAEALQALNQYFRKKD